MKIAQILVGLLCLTINLLAQNNNPNQDKYEIRIEKAEGPILLDGVVEEESWLKAEVASDFWQKTPRDDIKAVLRTEIRVTYDDQFLYVAGVCFDSTNHVIPTLKRDVGFWDGDGVGIMLDPLNEATTGFMFGISPFGVQMEALLGGGRG